MASFIRQEVFSASADSLTADFGYDSIGSTRSQSVIVASDSEVDIIDGEYRHFEADFTTTDATYFNSQPISSQSSIIQSTAATHGSSSPPLSEILSRYNLEAVGIGNDFFGPRIRHLKDVNAPETLIQYGIDEAMIKTIKHADELLKLLDDALFQLFDIQRDLFHVDRSKYGIELLDRWIWILLQTISKLNLRKQDRKPTQEQFRRKLNEISNQLTRASSYVMKISLNSRTADNLLKKLIRNHFRKFRLNPRDVPQAMENLKPKRSRFQNDPKLPLIPIPISEAGDAPKLRVGWSEAGGLILQPYGQLSYVNFIDLKTSDKLKMAFLFFATIKIQTIGCNSDRLEQMKPMLAKIRSTWPHFGKPTSMSLKYTTNGLENHILRLNFQLENSNTDKWDKALGYMFMQYVEDIRVRLHRVINTAESLSLKLERIQTEFERVEQLLESVMSGNMEELPEPKVGRMAVIISCTTDLPSRVLSILSFPKEKEASTTSVRSDDRGTTLGQRLGTADVKISIVDIEQPVLSRWGRIKHWFTSKNKTTTF